MQFLLYLGPIWFLILLLMNPLCVSSQSQHREVGEMTVSWHYAGEDILFTVTSPDKGWIVLGFNEEDNIVRATLHMGGYRESTGEQYFSERITLAPGDHRAKTDLQLPTQATEAVVSGIGNQGTIMRLRLPVNPEITRGYDLRPGRELWLILAYSVSDDLDHHSRFRRHVKVVL